MMNIRVSKGIALLEVMIAMGVIATAATALLLRMQSINNSTGFIEERTVAHWVAENVMQEMLADHALQKNIERVRSDQDTRDYDGREWHWSSNLEEIVTPELSSSGKKFYSLEIEVGLDPDKPLATLTGYVSSE